MQTEGQLKNTHFQMSMIDNFCQLFWLLLLFTDGAINFTG